MIVHIRALQQPPVYTPTSTATFALLNFVMSCRIAMLSGGLTIAASRCFKDACKRVLLQHPPLADRTFLSSLAARFYNRVGVLGTLLSRP